MHIYALFILYTLVHGQTFWSASLDSFNRWFGRIIFHTWTEHLTKLHGRVTLTSQSPFLPDESQLDFVRLEISSYIEYDVSFDHLHWEVVKFGQHHKQQASFTVLHLWVVADELSEFLALVERVRCIPQIRVSFRRWLSGWESEWVVLVWLPIILGIFKTIEWSTEGRAVRITG